MGFKENLKSELLYAGMMVKELAAVTGIKRHTIDNYLNTHNSIPNAEVAVKIAQALGVSVEYLITGEERFVEKNQDPFPKELRVLIDTWGRLNRKNRLLAITLVQALEKHENDSLN